MVALRLALSESAGTAPCCASAIMQTLCQYTDTGVAEHGEAMLGPFMGGRLPAMSSQHCADGHHACGHCLGWIVVCKSALGQAKPQCCQGAHDCRAYRGGLLTEWRLSWQKGGSLCNSLMPMCMRPTSARRPMSLTPGPRLSLVSDQCCGCGAPGSIHGI